MNNSHINHEDIIILTIGRMNPPTTGHLLLIKEMIHKAIEDNLTQINIILSHSEDRKKNPFNCDTKKHFLINDDNNESMTTILKKQMMDETPENADKIERIEVKIVCMNDITNPEYGTNPIMKSIGYILGEYYDYPRKELKIKLIIGEDRIKSYDWIKKYLNSQEPYPVNMEIIGLSRPENAMSATEMRNYALDNDWKTFNSKMSSTGLDEAVIRNIFDGIIINMKPTSIEEGPTKKRRRRGGRSTRRNSNRRKANRRKNTRRNGKKRKATRRKANIRKSSKKTKK